MRKITALLILLVTLVVIDTVMAGNFSFARRDYIWALADSSDIVIPEAEDSACCDKQSTLDARQIIPGERVDSLKALLPYKDKIWRPNPSAALVLSAAIPGGGQFYTRHYIKSAIYAGTELYLIKYIAWRWKWMNRHQSNFQNTDDAVYKEEQFRLYEKARDSRNLHLWLTGLMVFFSMFDAYVDAHLADFDQTDKAFQVYLAPEAERVNLNLVYNFK